MPTLAVVSIYVTEEYAYIPCNLKLPTGIYITTEPVYITKIDITDICYAINKVLDHGYPTVNVSRDELNFHTSAVLRAAKCKSWKALARNGRAYTISWFDNQISVDVSRLSTKGKWEFDPNKKRIFSSSTSLESISEIIIKDTKTYLPSKKTDQNLEEENS